MIEFPNKKYQIIYADPPWRYQDKGCNGNVESHYQTMNMKDLFDLKVESIAEKDSVLFLWTTFPMLQEGIELIKAWGFKYKSIAFLWVKQNKSGRGFFFGLGRWTRGNGEICLLATKGKPKRQNNSVSQLVVSPIQGHSRKPDEVRERIVKLMGDLPKIELFARNKTQDWDVWGNETDKFEEKLGKQSKLSLRKKGDEK